jgi:hypothetical protein
VRGAGGAVLPERPIGEERLPPRLDPSLGKIHPKQRKGDKLPRGYTEVEEDTKEMIDRSYNDKGYELYREDNMMSYLNAINHPIRSNRWFQQQQTAPVWCGTSCEGETEVREESEKALMQ